MDNPVDEKTASEGQSAMDVSSEEKGSAEQSSPETKSKKPLSFHLAFLGLLFMVFIVSLDTTTLAVAIPIIARDLGGTTLQSFWASTCFMLAVSVVQPLYLSGSDVLGRKIPLYTAYFLFIVGSLVFALAPNMATVIVGRTIQGLGGSGLDVLNEVITADMTTMKERPKYLGLLAIPMAGGALLGPIIGSLFTQYVTWRWIGWINLPLIGASFILTFFFLRLRPVEGTFLQKLGLLDLLGMALFVAGCAAFVLPLSWAGALYSWGSWRTLLPLILGLVVLALFVVYERVPAQPVLPYRLFKSATAITTFLGGFLHGLVTYTLNTYLPLFYQAAFYETPLHASVTLLPMNVMSLFFSCVSPISVSYLRKYRVNIWTGWVFLTVGTGLLHIITPASSVPFRTGLPIVVSLGIGVLFTVLVLPVQASVASVDDTGFAAGLLVFFRLLGGLVGLAIGSTVFSSVFEKSIKALGTLPSTLAALENSQAAVGFIPQLRDLRGQVGKEVLDQVTGVYSHSFHIIWIVLIVFAGVGLVASCFTKEVSMEKEELGRQRFEESNAWASHLHLVISTPTPTPTPQVRESVTKSLSSPPHSDHFIPHTHTMSLLRSNGVLSSCEPCRKSKIRCDHAAPCGRCRRRRKPALCVYQPAPMSKHPNRTDRSSTDSISCGSGSNITTNTSISSAWTSPLPSPSLVTPPLLPGHLRDGYLADCSHRSTSTPSTGVFGPTSYLSVLRDDVDDGSSSIALFAKSLQQNTSAIIDDSQIQLGAELLLILLDDFALYEHMATARFDHCQGDLFPPSALRLILSSIRTMLHEAISDPANPLPSLLILSRNIFTASSKPLIVDPAMTPTEYFSSMPNRWEIIGLVFAVIGSSACLLPQHDLAAYSPQNRPPLDKKGLAAVCVSASEICLRFFDYTGVISEQLCWATLEHASLLTLLYGDYDYRPYKTLSALITLLFTLGYHHRDATSKLPFFRAEHRKRLVVATYAMDKGLSTFLGRPPRMIRRYITIDPPLDIAFTDIIASTPSDFDRCPETAKVCLLVHMDSLYNEFILQRILVQRTGASTEKLIAVAHELLDNLLLLVANRAVGGGDGNSVVWIISSLGLPPAGVLAVELLHRFQNRDSNFQSAGGFPRSEIIQNLSRFAADLEYVVSKQAGNYGVCQQARSVIRHILDRVLGGRVPVVEAGEVVEDENGSENNKGDAVGEGTGPGFVARDWISWDFNAWMDEDSDLVRWLNSFE
ncbi:efflux pump antibiotic resistance protein [Aspergillus costaricaensis CBS 115574]|uniref:Efflux pump antibiotic resistance protein n=1 Tax=Aspergillus costaricaensis CBS 115574 TaxID=1448317 RepID=A0ACD1I4B6_9EURO|nr:efflux pump antibiotic resistance protein [Aspergillus costaricaensis CBS 115574]RAK84846.1 efflux pump antibiotic resistance protein [Aspergillus costaricaensis CBS 115574]